METAKSSEISVINYQYARHNITQGICIILRPFLQKETEEGQALCYTICFYRSFREVTLLLPPSFTNNQHLLTKMSRK